MARSLSSTSCSIFVGNVPYDAQEEELRDLFSKVGTVTSVRIVCDKDTKQPKGYAFCDFADSNSVQVAIDELNNAEYNGRKLRVDWAERELHSQLSRGGDDRPPRPMGSGGGGGGGGAPFGTSAASLAEPPPMPLPLPTIADRIAQLREQEAAQQARAAANDAAERAEIARFMETLTAVQLFQIIGDMQRLAVRAPEVARALLGENHQLAYALHHAQFLVGLMEEPPLPTDPEVKERARSVREMVFGKTSLPSQPPSTAASAAAAAMGLPGSLPGIGPPVLGPSPGASGAPSSSGPSALAAAITAAVGSLGATVTDPRKAATLQQLVHLSPEQIDALPHHAKLQFLDFLRSM